MPAEILPEDFRPCPRFPGYRVSRCGQRVQSCKVVRPVPGAPRGTVIVEFADCWRDLKIKPWLNKPKYLHVSLTVEGKTVNVGIHTLVLEAFVGPRPEGMEARHLNNDPGDNRLENLAWGTRAENVADMLRNNGWGKKSQRDLFPEFPEDRLRATPGLLASIGHPAETFWPVTENHGYRISNLGQLQSFRRMACHGTPNTWEDCKPAVGANGYHRYPIPGDDGRRRMRMIHHLVLEAFVGPAPEGYWCRHLDGNRGNNRLDNLAWGTPAENQADKVRHGTAFCGSRVPWAKLTEDDVTLIRRLHGEGWTQVAIAKRFGVNRTVIKRIIYRQRWRQA